MPVAASCFWAGLGRHTVGEGGGEDFGEEVEDAGLVEEGAELVLESEGVELGEGEDGLSEVLLVHYLIYSRHIHQLVE